MYHRNIKRGDTNLHNSFFFQLNAYWAADVPRSFVSVRNTKLQRRAIITNGHVHPEISRIHGVNRVFRAGDNILGTS
jgi:hypothetical protein